MPDEYDGIILGTGHNSLVLQAYMARSGLRVLAVDRAPAPGGGLATIENPRVPGFRHNTHSFFHRALTSMPWYRDLELERHGARYIEPELNVALILSDGRSLEWWTNFEKTAESFGEFSKRDAATLRRWVEEFRPIVERILVPEAQSPPLPPEQRQELLGRSRLGRRLLEVAALSPLEFVVREITRYEGPFPYIDGLILQVTQEIGQLLVEHLPRFVGTSNYTLRRLLRLWMNMFVNFSVMPLRISTLSGFVLSGLARRSGRAPLIWSGGLTQALWRNT